MMSFNILYVEDTFQDFQKLQKSIDAHNAEIAKAEDQNTQPLHIEWARSPDELRGMLDVKYDLILSDVYFEPQDGKFDARQQALIESSAPDRNEPNPSSQSQNYKKKHPWDKLEEIIGIVRDKSVRDGLGRPTPIIAYTSRGKDVLEECLQHRHELYDIWDKEAASGPYVAWRISQLAAEVARFRPDSQIRKLIIGMSATGRGSRWHTYVNSMVQRYDKGRTELEQISSAKHDILLIARILNDNDRVCSNLWRAITEWEPLSRAASPKIRGHARHVLNVFWLGYYLLHEQCLRPWFEQAWLRISKFDEMDAVRDENAIEALSDIWFYTALFHDAAGCIEKAHLLHEKFESITGIFGELAPKIPAPILNFSETPAQENIEDFLTELGLPWCKLMREPIERGIIANAPDHGLLAGIHLRRNIRDNKQQCYVRQAARAMAFHNLFPDIVGGCNVLSWNKEPISCLLLLCDQIQTWDRQRGGESADDKPQRAELLELRVEPGSYKPHLHMSIDYIAPQHLSRMPDRYYQVKDELEETIAGHPDRALRKLRDWPFLVSVECYLSGDHLKTTMAFGDEQ